MHFASPASPADFERIPIQILKVGGLGTHNCLGLAKAKGATFFLASTSEVYGDPLVHPQPEDYWGNVNPVGPRGVARPVNLGNDAEYTIRQLAELAIEVTGSSSEIVTAPLPVDDPTQRRP